MIIFIGGERSSIRSAKKYFLTHLLSSNMIIIGVVYLITKGQGVELVSVTPLVEDPEYSSFILYIMLAGLLINIAIFPFSGWMVNNYPTASGSGFLYLISFTTKVSILLLVKLFAGYEPLIYIAITMIIYASIKAIFEDNLMSLLCLLSIIVMGVMLAAIGKGGTDMIEIVIYYLFIHVIYKMLLSVSVVSIVDSTGIKNCSELRKVNSNIVLSALLIGIIIMMNIPMTSSFYMKSYISNAFLGNAVYFVTLFSSFMIAFSLPWKHYLVSKKYIEINLNIYCKLSIVLMSLVTIVIGLFGKKIFEMISDVTFNISNIDMLKQIIVILIALGISTHYSISRIHTKPVNLIEKVGSLLFYFYTRSLSIKVKEKKHSLFSNLDDKITKKLSSAHNQQTAIFIVFTIFIIILMILEI
ncbi:proton-conducting transporter membrane subunit, partial [Rickettsiaceae bacterium]|nr:proton-conducting transporter membrane subunit [Rickettsiaceae bacterium]